MPFQPNSCDIQMIEHDTNGGYSICKLSSLSVYSLCWKEEGTMQLFLPYVNDHVHMHVRLPTISTTTNIRQN